MLSMLTCTQPDVSFVIRDLQAWADRNFEAYDFSPVKDVR